MEMGRLGGGYFKSVYSKYCVKLKTLDSYRILRKGIPAVSLPQKIGGFIFFSKIKSEVSRLLSQYPNFCSKVKGTNILELQEINLQKRYLTLNLNLCISV